MTYEQYLESQGVFYIPSDGENPGNYAIRTLNADGQYDTNVIGYNDERLVGGYEELQRQQAQATPTPTPVADPVAQRDQEILNLIAAPTPTTSTPTPSPKSIQEYLQQQGYVYRPENRVETDGGMSGNFGGYGKYRTVGGGEVPEEQVFDEIERSETARYYEDPSRFKATRDTQFGKGLNTFNEGNENQKRILDQINTGQLYISPRLVAGRVLGEPEAGGEGYREETVYDLRDSRTGEPIQQQVKAIDAEKGIFNIVADDPNSSGFFNNYVSTDPKGFVNPIASEQQSQYQSKKNSSANFYRNVLQGTIAMATGVGAFGTTAALATSIGNTLGVTGAGALTVGSAVLGSASSAVLAAVTGGDVVKSAIAGGITAGVGANAGDIGTFIAGGADNVKAIADALNLTTKQVTTAISNAVTSGVVSAAVTGTDVTTAVTSTLASSVVGSYTNNLLANIPDLKDSATLISNVAKVATKAAVSGTDVGDALVNSIPSIIGGLVDDPKATGTKLKEEIVAEVADEIKTQTASTIEVGDTSDQSPGTEVLLADGTTGRVSNSGVIEPIDATSDMVTVGDRERKGTVSISGVVMEDANSVSGFSDDQGNPINQDGTPYLDPNAVDVAPDNVNITTPTTDQEILDLINPVVVRDDAVATGTTGATTTGTTFDPIATTGTTGTTGTGSGVTGNTGVTSTTSGGGDTGVNTGGSGVDTGGGFRGTTSTPLKTDTTTKTTTPTTNVVTTTDPTAEPLIVTGTQDPTIDTVDVVDEEEEETKPYTPFEEDFPLQTDEEKLRISPTVIPKKPSQPSRSGKNATLSTGLGIDTNVAALLGTGLPSRPDVSSTSEPYLLGKDDKRKDVWNRESLRGALGI